MARRKYAVRLNTESIGGLIRYLETYSLNLPTKCEQFVKRLGDIGIRVVNTEYPKTTADPDYDLSHTTELQLSSVGNTTVGRLIVSGEQVMFIEFGAGVFYNGTAGTSPHPQGKKKGYTIGSYGKHYGRRRAWYYQDEETGEYIKTHGVKAQMPVWKASQEMLAQVKDIAREVFNVGK